MTRADLVRAAARDHVRPAPLRTQILGHGLRLGIHVRVARVPAHVRAMELIQEHVAAVVVLEVLVARPVLEQDMAAQPQAGRCRGRLPRMVRLRGALGDDDVGPLRKRIAHHELELARLVPARTQPRTVIAFDPQARPAEVLGQPGHGLEQRGQMGETDPLVARKVHGCSGFL